MPSLNIAVRAITAMTRHCSVAAAAVTALLILASGAATADVLLRTDASWKVSPAIPSGDDWFQSPSFNDSAWQNATLLYEVGLVGGGPGFLGTYGIWSSDGQYSTTETQAWFRKTFTLTGPLSAASLIVGCDDDCTMYVNGVLVIDDRNGSANDSNVPDLLPFLNVGTNLIAYTVTDNYPVWGYNHSTWAQIEGTFQRAVPEPSTIALFGVGLAAILASRRRKA